MSIIKIKNEPLDDGYDDILSGINRNYVPEQRVDEEENTNASDNNLLNSNNENEQIFQSVTIKSEPIEKNIKSESFSSVYDILNSEAIDELINDVNNEQNNSEETNDSNNEKLSESNNNEKLTEGSGINPVIKTEPIDTADNILVYSKIGKRNRSCSTESDSSSRSKSKDKDKSKDKRDLSSTSNKKCNSSSLQLKKYDKDDYSKGKKHRSSSSSTESNSSSKSRSTNKHGSPSTRNRKSKSRSPQPKHISNLDLKKYDEDYPKRKIHRRSSSTESDSSLRSKSKNKHGSPSTSNRKSKSRSPQPLDKNHKSLNIHKKSIFNDSSKMNNRTNSSISDESGQHSVSLLNKNPNLRDGLIPFVVKQEKDDSDKVPVPVPVPMPRQLILPKAEPLEELEESISQRRERVLQDCTEAIKNLHNFELKKTNTRLFCTPSVIQNTDSTMVNFSPFGQLHDVKFKFNSTISDVDLKGLGFVAFPEITTKIASVIGFNVINIIQKLNHKNLPYTLKMMKKIKNEKLNENDNNLYKAFYTSIGVQSNLPCENCNKLKVDIGIQTEPFFEEDNHTQSNLERPHYMSGTMSPRQHYPPIQQHFYPQKNYGQSSQHNYNHVPSVHPPANYNHVPRAPPPANYNHVPRAPPPAHYNHVPSAPLPANYNMQPTQSAPYSYYPHQINQTNPQYQQPMPTANIEVPIQPPPAPSMSYLDPRRSSRNHNFFPRSSHYSRQ